MSNKEKKEKRCKLHGNSLVLAVSNNLSFRGVEIFPVSINRRKTWTLASVRLFLCVKYCQACCNIAWQDPPPDSCF